MVATLVGCKVQGKASGEAVMEWSRRLRGRVGFWDQVHEVYMTKGRRTEKHSRHLSYLRPAPVSIFLSSVFLQQVIIENAVFCFLAQRIAIL